MSRFAPLLALLLCATLHPVAQPTPASEGAHVAALREMMRTVNAGDAAGYARLYAENAVITIFGTGELRGRAAIEQHERELLSQFPGTRLAFYSVWEHSRDAVVHYAVNGRTPSGQAMGHEGLLFYRFTDSGLIEEERRYLDSLTPMAQLGLLPGRPVRPLPKLPDDVTVYRATTGGSGDIPLVKAAVGALDSNDRAAFLPLLQDDVVVDDVVFPAPFAGKHHVQSWLDQWSVSVADARSEIASIRSIGTFVLVETIMRGTLDGDLAGVAASGKPFAVHRGLIVQLTNGKISRLTSFMNRKELADAVGHALVPRK